MVRPTNQDIGEFKEDFYKGLSPREFIYAALALLVGVCGIVTLIRVYKMNVNLAVTICIPFIAFIGVCGFYEKNKMTLWQVIRRAIRLKRQKPLTYHTRMIIRNTETKDVGKLEAMLIKLNQKRR